MLIRSTVAVCIVAWLFYNDQSSVLICSLNYFYFRFFNHAGFHIPFLYMTSFRPQTSFISLASPSIYSFFSKCLHFRTKVSLGVNVKAITHKRTRWQGSTRWKPSQKQISGMADCLLTSSLVYQWCASEKQSGPGAAVAFSCFSFLERSRGSEWERQRAITDWKREREQDRGNLLDH